MSDLKKNLGTAMGVPFLDGNRIDVLKNGQQIFPCMLDAIQKAESLIDFATFVYWKGDIAMKFADSLAERAQAGVRVRVLLDAVGSFPMRAELIEKMESAGVEVQRFRPIRQWQVWKWDNRTHRKILICDCSVGFTGGVGIAEEWEGDAQNEHEWRDTHFRIEGPAVRVMHSAFLSNWSEAVDSPDMRVPDYGPLQHRGTAGVQVVCASSSENWSMVALLFRCLIGAAKYKLLIATAYFVPDPVLSTMLCDAVKRGVEVVVLVPGEHSDSLISQLGGRNDYETLLSAGVKICRFQPSMMHAKIVLVDDAIAVVGSANMNHRSMSLDEECCLVIDHRDTIDILDQHYREDLDRSKPLGIREWKGRPLWSRLGELLARFIRVQL